MITTRKKHYKKGVSIYGSEVGQRCSAILIPVASGACMGITLLAELTASRFCLLVMRPPVPDSRDLWGDSWVQICASATRI
jgi:hypothetical protein